MPIAKVSPFPSKVRLHLPVVLTQFMKFTHYSMLAAATVATLSVLPACNDAKTATAAETAVSATATAVDSAATASITTAGPDAKFCQRQRHIVHHNHYIFQPYFFFS
jgi:branched-subunit amino acid transport protein